MHHRPHDTGLLDRVCNNIIAIDNLKLKQQKGNLTDYVKNPKARSFFELKSSPGSSCASPSPASSTAWSQDQRS